MGKNVYTVSESENGLRLDNFLKDRSGLSRAEVQKWIKEGGAILSPDKMIRPNYQEMRFSLPGKRRKNWKSSLRIFRSTFYMRMMT